MRDVKFFFSKEGMISSEDNMKKVNNNSKAFNYLYDCNNTILYSRKLRREFQKKYIGFQCKLGNVCLN